MFDLIKTFANENKLILIDELPLDWDRYKNWIPSVTWILRLFKEPWFEYVKRHYPKEVAKACERWTNIHQWAEDYFNGKTDKMSKQIMKFHVLYDFDIIAQEDRIEKDISGTIDVVGWSPLILAGEIINVDYKTNTLRNIKYVLQICWYKYLNWYNGAICYMSNANNSNKIHIEVVDADKYMPVFLELKDYFFYLLARKQNDNNSIS